MDAGVTRPNVLLVVLDSVRAANTSLHGHDRDTTPFLASFAERDDVARFSQARSPGNTSLTSHTSMFTGHHAAAHGLTSDTDDLRLAPGNTVWERLGDAGYRTGVFSNNPFLTELDVGLSDAFGTVVARRQELPYPDGVNVKNFLIGADQGPSRFIEFARAAADSDRPLGSLVNGLAFKLAGTRLERTLPPTWRTDGSAGVYLDAFLEWQAERSDHGGSTDGDRPWAACVNLMDAHFPYEPGPHAEWSDDADRHRQATIQSEGAHPWSYVDGDRPRSELRSLVDLYDGAIRHLDAQLERLVDALERRGALEDTLLVITADHGEGFAEPSSVREGCRYVGHGNGGVGEELVHVPLLVCPPAPGAGDPGDHDPSEEAITAPASLTRFPDAVEAALDGRLGAVVEAFTRGDVVAWAAGVGPDAAVDASAVGVDPSPYRDEAVALYRTGEDCVLKHERWGPAHGTFLVDSSGAVTPLEPSDDGTRRGQGGAEAPADLDELGDVAAVDVLEQRDGEDVDAATADRLAALGYR